MKVSIVISTFNRRNDLEHCIESLVDMECKPHEIIVVDSSSNDGTQELKDCYPIKYLSIEQKNREVARNIGIDAATGDIIAFFDDDVVVDRKWLSQILKLYSNHEVGGVGGRAIELSGLPFSNTSEVGKVRLNGVVISNFDVSFDKPLEVDFLPGCNMSFRRDVLLEVQGWDENFGGNCYRDDTDLCLRVRKLGYKLIYQPNGLVRHKRRGKHVKFREWAYWYFKNTSYFYFKNIFTEAPGYLPLFILRQILPPRVYLWEANVQIKPDILLPFTAFKGLLDGLRFYKRTNAVQIH